MASGLSCPQVSSELQQESLVAPWVRDAPRPEGEANRGRSRPPRPCPETRTGQSPSLQQAGLEGRPPCRPFRKTRTGRSPSLQKAGLEGRPPCRPFRKNRLGNRTGQSPSLQGSGCGFLVSGPSAYGTYGRTFSRLHNPMNEQPLPNRRRPAHHPPIERFNEPVFVLVTVCTQDRRPVLASPSVHSLCREIWQAADYWRVGRYVLMPDHLHLFCAPGRIPMPRLNQWVEFWKSRVAVQWPKEIKIGEIHISGGPTSVSAVPGRADGTEPVPPEIRDGGPTSVSAVSPKAFKLWQRDFWDTQMRSREHYDEKWTYVRMNPVRKGLAQTPDDWPYQGEVFPLAWR
jgi:putative transposase